jgi:hypothetical protein
MKSTIFWDITPCSSLKVNRRFGGRWPLSSGFKNKPSSNLLANCFHAGFLLGSFHPEDGGDVFLQNVG